MKVEFIKDYTDNYGRKFPKGKKTSLSKKFAEQLIKEKVVKPVKDFVPTKELEQKLKKIGVNIKE